MVHSFYRSTQPSGENWIVEAEVAALQRAGNDVELFAAHTNDLEEDRLYPLRAAVRVATSRGSNPLKALSRFSPDIVHIHNLFPNFGRRWVDALDVPLIHTLHNYRPLCANGLLLRDGVVCTRCPDGDRWAGLRYACYRNSRLATLPLTWANRRGPMSDPILRRADRLIVGSERQLQVYAAAGVPPERMFLSPNFLPDQLDPGSSGDPPDGGWLFVGRLSAEKGILRLLKHWPMREPLTIIGDGPQRAEVERLGANVGAQVTGPLPRDSVLTLMQRARGLVFPSLWYEVSPLVYLEALAATLPVIAFEPSIVATAVRQESTGVVSNLTTREITKALKQVSERGSALRLRCRQVFNERYSESSYHERVRALYTIDSHRR